MTTSKTERIGYICVYSISDYEYNSGCRWRTDEYDLEHIREMIKKRPELVKPQIKKVTTIEEYIE